MTNPDHKHARPADRALYMRVFGELSHMNRADAVRLVARERNQAVKDVSRMVSRAAQDPTIHIELLAYLQRPTSTTPAGERIQQIIEAHCTEQRAHHAALSGLQYAVFLSDVHFPYARLDALDLYYKIIADLQPVYLSALNDALDFPRLSTHIDTRTVAEQRLDSDISQALAMYDYHLRVEYHLVPTAMRIAIVGNHEDRLMRYVQSGLMEYNALNFIEQLAGAGVRFLSHVDRVNAFALNKTLAWAHGWSAAASQKTVATHAIQATAQWLGSPRKVFDVVTGHTHRTGVTRVGVAEHYNNGCACKLNPHYMRKRPLWQLGVTISHFDPHGEYHSTQVVEFVPLDGQLTARYNGKTYSTPLREE